MSLWSRYSHPNRTAHDELPKRWKGESIKTVVERGPDREDRICEVPFALHRGKPGPLSDTPNVERRDRVKEENRPARRRQCVDRGSVSYSVHRRFPCNRPSGVWRPSRSKRDEAMAQGQDNARKDLEYGAFRLKVPAQRRPPFPPPPIRQKAHQGKTGSAASRSPSQSSRT